MKAAKVMLEKCMGLKSDERCLIVTDPGKKAIAALILEEASDIAKSEIVEMPMAKVNGEEPPVEIAAKMKDYEVVIMLTSKSLSHTNARKEASAKGARIASMPGITLDMMERAIDVDYGKVIERTAFLADRIDSGKMVRVTTPAGTDITLSIEGRLGRGRNSGIFDEPGKWGNLPAGEAFCAPVEGTTNGVYVVDASQAGIEKLNGPLTIKVEQGYAVAIKGADAEEFRTMLESVEDKNAFNIAELGIGTNDKAKITGIILEDEKVFGTCHIALGNNFSFGGKVNVPVHVDGVMLDPDIYIDDVQVMKKGILQR